MIQGLLLIAGIHLLAVMSPGPDFAMVVRNSLVYSRRTGVLAAAGLGLGIIVHVLYSLLGIGLLISQSVMLFNAIKWAGALYLIFIGFKALLAKKASDTADKDQADVPKALPKKDLSTAQAIRMGFITNVLNPKATMYFLAVFTTVIQPDTALIAKIVYGLAMVVITFAWFAFVAVVLSHNRVSGLVGKWKHYIDRVFGGVLIALGIKVALGNK
ncbi:LysE family translocator [Candidatus Saccharibacteria bacterium]|nr:MAG: LysE family translocator [Candidatus Saccharibacteria bacterium]